MAGVVPKKSSSGRKQWTLHGGPKSSLKRLRSQLASDGCPESQVVLAKQLLGEQCEFESEKKENARLGVYWLIKASEQGNTEATDLLRTCLETGKGITEHNYLDVKSCISMTQDEKLARKAAREMFASLSNGGDYITSDQLQKKILDIDRGETSSKATETRDLQKDMQINGELMNNYEETSDSEEETDWSQRSDVSNEKLTEDHLVAAAVDYSHGNLPLVNRILCLSDPNLRALDHIPFVHRSILHPLLALKILYFKLIRFLGQKTIPLLFPLAKSEIQFVILLLIYSLISSDNIIFFLPMLAYYLSFGIMLFTTFQMLQIKREFFEFHLWSGLFICYSGGSLNAEQAEHQYIRNNLKPCGHFFIALLVNFLVYPIISEQWIPQSELSIIAFCLTFMTLFGFMPKRHSKTVCNTMVLFSFAINVLAKYPYEIDPVVTQGWRFLELNIPTFPSYIIGNGIEFCINFRLLLYTCIPLLFVKIASQQNWRGTYQTLIPHCVTLSWLQICIINSQGATMFGLLRGTLALVGVVLFLPLVGLTSIILPVAALTKWIITSNAIYSLFIFVILTLLGLAICWLCAQTRFKNYTAVIQICLTVGAFIALINSTTRDLSDDGYYVENKLPDMTWELYQRFCHQPIWQEDNIAVGQMKCAELENIQIHWDGYIGDVKIKKIRNAWKNLFDKFPNFISEYCYCLFGEEVSSDCQNVPEMLTSDCEYFHNSIKSISKCSLQKYNIYTFDVSIKMQPGIWGKSIDLNINVENYFRNFTLKLKPNDHIWFKGLLMNNEFIGPDGILGGTKPNINLVEIGCIACQNTKLTELKLNDKSLYNINTLIKSLFQGFKFVLNVLLNPIVVFK